jgi:hypothetical protein
MNRVIKTLGWTLLIAVLASVAVVVALASSASPWDGSGIVFDGEPLTFAQFHIGHWLVGVVAVTLALVIALIVVVLVVPVAVFVPLLIAAIALIGALVVVVGVTAMAFSPLLLAVGAVWLMWRLARGERTPREAAREATTKSGATIAG